MWYNDDDDYETETDETSETENWQEYEDQKASIDSTDMEPNDYEDAIQSITDKLDI